MINIADLPSPPKNKKGWPWDSCRKEFFLSPTIDLPKVSIVTPSYNQGEFIEETIRSVILQNYTNLEYIIIDGGSTDSTLELIAKYEKWINFWVSEKDAGQSDALNKGFQKAEGKIFAWLNSDDYLNHNAINNIITQYLKNRNTAMFIGKTQEIDRHGNRLRLLTPKIDNKKLIGNWGTGSDADCHFHQPSVFFNAAMFKESGGINNKHHIAMDVELWIKLSNLGDIRILDEVLSFARIYPEAKSFNDIERVFVEMIALNFNMGNIDIAKHYLKRYESYLTWKKRKK